MQTAEILNIVAALAICLGNLYDMIASVKAKEIKGVSLWAKPLCVSASLMFGIACIMVDQYYAAGGHAAAVAVNGVTSWNRVIKR
jgi:uncharacterized protein with PQ loop repeat